MADDDFTFFDPVDEPAADTIPPAWVDFYQGFPGHDSLLRWINAKYAQCGTMCPPRSQLFRALALVAPQDVKVVILGQDPYHTRGVANGLAFSCDGRLQPSLANIFTELKADTGISRSNGDLEDWARQGVLLLNTALTVEQGRPNCHRKDWDAFTKYTVRKLMRDYKRIVFILWGNNARSVVRPYKQYNFTNQHVCIESAHPSPLSASKGFFGSKPFSQCNAALRQLDKAPVAW